jgi:O-acetyl-ADP-ribose deacetylase (regulator of RNase III)
MDIVEVITDVVVNPANGLSFTPNDCGVSGVLRDACSDTGTGANATDVCNQPKHWIDDMGVWHTGNDLPETQACLQAAGGRLQQQGVKFVIHANGPRWQQFSSEQCHDPAGTHCQTIQTKIQTTVTRALNVAASNRLRSITVPCISGGLFTHSQPKDLQEREQAASRKAVLTACMAWAQTCAADTSVCQIVVVDHPTAGRLGLLESEFDIATKMQSRQSAPVSSNSGFRDAYGPSSSGSNGLTDIVSSNTGFGDAYGSSSSGSNGLTDMLATMQASMQQNHADIQTLLQQNKVQHHEGGASPATVRLPSMPRTQASPPVTPVNPPQNSLASVYLTAPSAGWQALRARVEDFVRIHGGGHAVALVGSVSETSMVLKCKICKVFKVKCGRQRTSRTPGEHMWKVNFEASVWTHEQMCCSKPQVTAGCWRLPSVRQHIRTKLTASTWTPTELEKWMLSQGFRPPAGLSTHARHRVYTTLVNRVFNNTEAGRTQDISKLLSWRDSFNVANNGSNGKCTVGFHAPASSGTATASQTPPVTGCPNVLNYVNIVFASSVKAFGTFSVRVLDIDAAYLEETRKDMRYILVEMHTTNNKIVPMCFHLCFGENTESYIDMWECLLNYNDGEGCLRDLIDSKDTRLNGDRNSSLRAATEEMLKHGKDILHNDLVHLLRNVHTNVKLRGNRKHSASMYVKELSRCATHEQEQVVFDNIKLFDEKLYAYLFNKSDKQWWISAYFTHMFDCLKTTSNGAEQENGRMKRLLIRAMLVLDMLDGVCELVSEVWTTEETDATFQCDKQCAWTNYADVLIKEKFAMSKLYTVKQGRGHRCVRTTNGPFTVVLASDIHGSSGSTPFQVQFSKSKQEWECNEPNCWMKRHGGLLCEHAWCCLAHRSQTPADHIAIFQSQSNGGVVPAAFMCKELFDITGGFALELPVRQQLLESQPGLVMPECSATNAPQGKQKKRFAGRGEPQSASTCSPPAQRIVSHAEKAAQELLRHGLNDSQCWLIVLYKNRSGNSSSTFASGVLANRKYRPFRYMPGNNVPTGRVRMKNDSHGRPRLLGLDSILKPPGPRTLNLYGVMDAVVVDRDMALQCARDGSWIDPRNGAVHGPAHDGDIVIPDSQDADSECEDEYEIEKVVDERRVDHNCTDPEYEYLVRWSGYDDTEDWWLKLSQLGSCMQMVEAFQRSNTRQLIFNSHTQPLLFSAITANAADVSIYDKELELWVTVVVRKVHMSSIKAKRGDNDKYTTITKQTWLRRRSVLNQRSGTM